VTTLGEGTPAAVASDKWSKDLDETQFAEHEGPCLDAFRTGNVFRIRDFTTDNRWPSYSVHAMRSRAVIEQAKGILMARLGCDADAAFNELKTLSQHSNRKLRDLAAEIVAETARSKPA
jgi:hypothetical protein